MNRNTNHGSTLISNLINNGRFDEIYPRPNGPRGTNYLLSMNNQRASQEDLENLNSIFFSTDPDEIVTWHRQRLDYATFLFYIYEPMNKVLYYSRLTTIETMASIVFHVYESVYSNRINSLEWLDTFNELNTAEAGSNNFEFISSLRELDGTPANIDIKMEFRFPNLSRLTIERYIESDYESFSDENYLRYDARFIENYARISELNPLLNRNEIMELIELDTNRDLERRYAIEREEQMMDDLVLHFSRLRAHGISRFSRLPAHMRRLNYRTNIGRGIDRRSRPALLALSLHTAVNRLVESHPRFGEQSRQVYSALRLFMANYFTIFRNNFY